MFAFEIIWHTDMFLPLLMSDLSYLFTCQFCTCFLDCGCCILLGNLTRRDPRRRKWKKYVSFFQYSRCLCIAQLICFIVYHVLVLNMGGLENVHYCFGVWFYLLVHYILVYLLFWTLCHLLISISCGYS